MSASSSGDRKLSSSSSSLTKLSFSETTVPRKGFVLRSPAVVLLLVIFVVYNLSIQTTSNPFKPFSHKSMATTTPRKATTVIPSLSTKSDHDSSDEGLVFGVNTTTFDLNEGEGEEIGAIVFLAPPRYSGVGWNDGRVTRFCMLMRAVRSADEHLNQFYGPYPIYILVSKDYDKADVQKKEGPYTDHDQNVISRWAPNSNVVKFIEIDMYSGHALEPNSTRSQIQDWRYKGKDGAIKGRDIGYQSMCRLWSGRLQGMDFLKEDA